MSFLFLPLKTPCLNLAHFSAPMYHKFSFKKPIDRPVAAPIHQKFVGHKIEPQTPTSVDYFLLPAELHFKKVSTQIPKSQSPNPSVIIDGSKFQFAFEFSFSKSQRSMAVGIRYVGGGLSIQGGGHAVAVSA
ncbi:hypothetical protein AMTRI_Chr03g141410 [Amborella trichopoda]